MTARDYLLGALALAYLVFRLWRRERREKKAREQFRGV